MKYGIKKYILSLCMLAIEIVCLIMAIISFVLPKTIYDYLIIIIDVAVIIANIVIILLKE